MRENLLIKRVCFGAFPGHLEKSENISQTLYTETYRTVAHI